MRALTSPSRSSRPVFPIAFVGALIALAGSLAAGRGQDPAPVEALAAEHAVGRVIDREGVAASKSVLADRWGPADAQARIEPGDWLKTGTRGANALKFSLAGGAELVLGPGGLVEAVDGGRIVLNRGELRASVPEGDQLVVTGPNKTTIRATGRSVLSARDGRLERLDEDPRWLAGYENDSSTEAMGSLLANVDGRNVPLTIGYHKVTVDIRDQIARTVIEESFVNHTSSVLEGVFYFPLPGDASISGFGMWIGEELVQGDIVEKQRAREIYETILREKRDPGLLEWAGGSIFKARVYPIGAEKRIRIAYTQVLPKRGNTYSYNYGLQSELLRLNPLKTLAIEVNVSSAEEIESVECPSHDCRIRTTEGAAKVEFEAEEFIPDSDFELRIATVPDGGGVTVIPHRRGDDGYFMLLVDAPDAVGNGHATGPERLDVVVMADTSGSMQGPARRTQIAFVEALLGSLGERDTFTLLTCDAETRWAFERARNNTGSAREDALRFLEEREPLGWSDLDGAFEEVFERIGPDTHVVYVGDGEPTSGDADPAAFANRLARLHGGSGSFHAVVPGTRAEPIVLRAIAGLGGGSLRSIGGGSDPATAAFALIEEIASPTVKGLSLDFEGMSVAAVYPTVLPNLPAGGQQVVVGRFDPTLGEPTGRVKLAGDLAGEPVAFVTEVALDPEDGGNSFIPRLWARHHLDHLLEQGSSPEVKERIVGLSEDFQIITPYTSFLVLESEADRERFKVEKNFRMRDGEEFFAEGRDDARHELTRQQMLLAKGWQKRLRARALMSLGRMNRELTELLRGGPVWTSTLAVGAVGGKSWGLREVERGLHGSWEKNESEQELWDQDGREWKEDHRVVDELEGREFGNDESDMLEEESAVELAYDMPMSPAESRAPNARYSRAEAARKRPNRQAGGLSSFLGQDYGGRAQSYDDAYGYYGYYDAFGPLFSPVPAGRAADPEWTWSEDVRAVLRTLDRRTALGASDLGWSIEVDADYTDARGRSQATRGSHLVGVDRWLTVAPHVSGQAYSIQWSDAAERGHLTVGWNLGRVRAAEDSDASAWAAPFTWHFGDHIRRYVQYDARVEEAEDGLVRVVFSLERTPENTLTLTVDTERAVVLEQSWAVGDDVTSRLEFGAFHEAGGLWWPGEIKSWNKSRTDSTTTKVRVATLDALELERRIASALEVRADSIVLGDEIEDAAVAKQAVKDGTAGLEHRWFLLRHFAGTQRWDEAAPHLEAIRSLAADKPGLLPIRATYLQQSRRNEELRQLLMESGSDFAASPRDAEHGIVQHLLNFASGLNQGNELLAFLRTIEPVFDRQGAVIDAKLPFDQRLQQALQNMGRPAEAYALLERMAADYPYHVNVLVNWANEMARRGDVEEALAFLTGVEADNGPWQEYEIGQLRQSTAQVLWNSYRLEEFVETVEAWQRDDPSRVNAQLNNQWLSAMIFLDREEKAWGFIETWLTEYRKPELEPFEQYRFQAAIQHALGNGHNLYHTRYEDDRAAILADTARYLASLEDGHHYLAGQILQNWYFRQVDPVQDLFGDLYAELEDDLADMSAQRVARVVSWLRGASFSTDAGEDGWQSIFDSVYERWLATENEQDRQALSQVIVGYGRRELALRYHRRAFEIAEDGAMKVAAAQTLFHALMAGEWSSEVQDELVALLPTMSEVTAEGSDGSEAELDRRVTALYDLTGWLPDARAAATVAALPDVNSMTRRGLKSARETALKSARVATAELLLGLETSLEPEELRVWASIERVFLLVQARTDLSVARSRSLEILTALVTEHEAAETEADVILRDRILAARCAATYAHLLSRYADADRAEHEPAFVELLDSGIASGHVLIDWREFKYALLLALDRGDAIEAALHAWFGDGEDFSKIRWGRDYAYVRAERNDIAGAAEVLVEIERIDELAHDDYRTLADWYTALDRPDDAREARIQSWLVSAEHVIGQALSNESGTYQRRGDDVPPELDPEIPLRFVALMRKAPHPANWSWVLQSYYASTKDFRLLECLPEALIGHTAQGVYPFLSNVSSIASNIDEEATVDRLRSHLAELHGERAETDVDRRALRLLEFMVVQLATHQANGTEEHARIALDALREAFKGEWSVGEPTMMAEFLAARGALQPTTLAEEQLRQLRELRGVVDHPLDRFVVSGHLAHTLWAYGRREPAIRALTGALDELRDASDGRLPQDANHQLTNLSGWLEVVGEYRTAERMWQAELAVDYPGAHRLWLEQNLFGLYRDAILARAEVSLGSGHGLYREVVRQMKGALLVRTNEQHAHQLVSILCDLWTRANRDLKDLSVERDVSRFAFTGLPRILDLYQYRNGQYMVGTVADCVSSVNGPRTALDFLAVRAENERRWLRLQNQDFWSQHAWRFANFRRAAGKLDAALEERVLAIVLRELREDLRTAQARNRSMYDHRHYEYWSEKRGDFRRTALEFLEGDRSSDAVTYAAEYLFRGISAHDEAIDALYRLYRKSALEIDGRTALATYLQERKRWGESIPVLAELIEERPANVGYRVMAMRGHFYTDDGEALAKTLADAEAWFREHDLWNEPTIAGLADGCLETQLFAECAAHYDEAIALHVKSAPNRGVGDGTLCQYYRNQAGAYSGLGRTDDAVDACAGAIVSWGQHIVERQRDLQRLEDVLFAAEDLEAFVERLDAETTDVENPIVRKALARVYVRKRAHGQAVVQLRRALEGQPDDTETHELLVATYDAMDEGELAASALTEWARVAGHELRLYRNLGERFTALERPGDSERAYTHMVEVMPNESESHLGLAEVREKQGRWQDAAEHWRHVIRVRTEEPTGYTALARVLIRLERFDEAREVVDEILTHPWPERFGDIRAVGRSLLREIEPG